MTTYERLVLLVIGLVIIMFALTRLGVFSGRRPQNLGVTSGQLSPCPGTPNCVNSQAKDKAHSIEPLPFDGPLTSAQDKLLAVLMAMPRTKIVTDQPGYIYVEFKTAIMRYTDDVEFWFDESLGVIHMRSASRLGTGDLGLNRRRMEEIRKSYLAYP
ncbi:MAG: DUF1499 domain-containing protein [Anaerolineae bacterium]|nr:DUF1499 domain-containing protein [Anaerolineae bacterium]